MIAYFPEKSRTQQMLFTWERVNDDLNGSTIKSSELKCLL